MAEMKADMTGGATVANALLALAKRKAESNAVAVIPLVENMCSGTATRPGDVYVVEKEGSNVLLNRLFYKATKR